MRAFEFSLRQVLGWRRTQLELEENKLRQFVAQLEELRLEAIRLGQVQSRAEAAVRDAAEVEAGDLWALAAYRKRLIEDLEALSRRRAAAKRQVETQRDRVVEAQRNCRLMEKLEERRRAEWKQAQDRELENLAAESFLASWNRRL